MDQLPPGTNPYAVARDAIASQAVPSAPPSYKGRLIAQMALLVLLFAMSCAYLILAVIDSHKRKRPIYRLLIRLQRLREGRMIVVNALFVFVLFSAFSACYLIFVKVRLYQVLYQGHSLENLIFILLSMPIFPFLSGLCYTFSNLAAVAAISKKGVGLESVSRLWVVTHNAGFCLSPLIFFGVTFPLSAKINAVSNNTFKTLGLLYVTLDEAAKTFATSPEAAAAFDAPVAALTQSMKEDEATMKKFLMIHMVIGTTFCTFFAIAALASFGFVSKLRKQSRWNRTRTTVAGGTSVFVTREQRTVVEEPEAGEMDGVAIHSPRTAIHPQTFPMPSKTQTVGFEASTTFGATNAAAQNRASTRLRSVASENAEHAALTRLAYDLSMSLPLIIFMSIAFPVLTWAGVFLDQTKWAVRELAFDGFSWSAIATSLAIIGFFLANIILNRGRYTLNELHGKTTESDPNVSGIKSFGLKMRNMASNNGSGQPAGLSDDRRAVQISVHDFDMVNGSYTKADDASAVDEKEKW